MRTARRTREDLRATTRASEPPLHPVGHDQPWHAVQRPVWAVLAEIAALLHLPIGIVYLAILGLETLLVLVAAAWFGEPVGVREAVGAAMILAGTVLLAASDG